MKALASVFIVSSLFLTILGPGTASGDTNGLLRAKHPAAAPTLSHPASQILQLTQAGMDESVITSFISTAGIFQLSADQILYFNDLGISKDVIEAMLTHDREKIAASSQNTNVSNGGVATQAQTATIIPVVKPTSQNLAPTNGPAESQLSQLAVNTPSSAKPDSLPKVDSATSQRPHLPQAVPPKKKVFYPVRAPYPVELTAPIVFLDAPTF